MTVAESAGDWTWPDDADEANDQSIIQHDRRPRVRTYRLTFLEQINELPSTCSICLSGYEINQSISSAPCPGNHTFHCDCLTDWLVACQRRGQRSSCPMCRGGLNVAGSNNQSDHSLQDDEFEL